MHGTPGAAHSIDLLSLSLSMITLCNICRWHTVLTLQQNRFWAAKLTDQRKCRWLNLSRRTGSMRWRNSWRRILHWTSRTWSLREEEQKEFTTSVSLRWAQCYFKVYYYLINRIADENLVNSITLYPRYTDSSLFCRCLKTWDFCPESSASLEPVLVALQPAFWRLAGRQRI